MTDYQNDDQFLIEEHSRKNVSVLFTNRFLNFSTHMPNGMSWWGPWLKKSMPYPQQ